MSSRKFREIYVPQFICSPLTEGLISSFKPEGKYELFFFSFFCTRREKTWNGEAALFLWRALPWQPRGLGLTLTPLFTSKSLPSLELPLPFRLLSMGQSTLGRGCAEPCSQVFVPGSPLGPLKATAIKIIINLPFSHQSVTFAAI